MIAGRTEIAARIGGGLLDPCDPACCTEFFLGFGPDQKLLDVALHGADYRPAAVLVPLIDRGDHVTVLLTQRSAHLPDHAGQISFPGGRVEDEDEDIVAAALREAQEEVGLNPAGVEVLGALEQRGTISNYRVTPIVGLVEPFDPVPQAEEVAAIFEVPLDFILDPGNHQFLPRGPDGTRRRMYAIPYEEWLIFGLTARILVQIAQLWHGEAAATLFPHEGEQGQPAHGSSQPGDRDV